MKKNNILIISIILLLSIIILTANVSNFESSTVSDYLKNNGVDSWMGNSAESIEQTNDLIKVSKLVKKTNIDAMEIGFSAGHSAETLLKNNPNLNLVSFDIGSSYYVQTAKEYIDKEYPGRFTLIIGDSVQTVPRYINDNKGKTFDLIFIDGNHEYAFAKKDIDNCKQLSNKDTIIIVDDIMYDERWEADWTIGPTKAWKEYISDGKIIELGRNEYNKEPGKGRGMVWGKFIF